MDLNSSMDAKEVLIAFTAVAVSITFAAGFILCEIWRKRYTKIDPETNTAKELHDNGVKWLFVACMLWSVTSVIGLMQLTNLLPSPGGNENSYLQFILIGFSLTNSLCFVLATANFDETLEEIREAEKEKRKPSLAARVLNQINRKRYRIWICLIIVGAILWSMPLRIFKVSYCNAFDVFITFITLCWLGWAFLRTFRARNFPILKWFAAPAFVLFFISQLGNAHFLFSAEHQLRRIAFSVSMDGIVALLFFTLAFSWADKRAQDILEMYVDKPIEPATTVEVKGTGA